MNSWKRHTITAALPYANGPLHIGHIAGCYLPADVYVRYLKQKERDVMFICGSDEHGVPITIRARKEGVSPQQIVDKYHAMMKKAFDDFGIHFSQYGRTSSDLHKKTASDFFKKLFDEGKFTEEESEQYYDAEANSFLADRYISGECPNCHNPDAYGDQCEKCGKSLDPADLINPRSALSGSAPVKRKTKNWYLPLNKLQPKVWAYMEKHKDWKVNVYGQCKSWMESGDGLQPRSMTRDLDWGIPVPVKGAEGKVLYVWFDAPIGYISNTIEHFEQQPASDALQAEAKQKGLQPWELYWKDKDSRLIHFIGKDNIVFHCIIFPAMLMEHGGFVVADNVPGNEFLNLEGNKLSTSRNWAVWLHEYLEDFPGKQDELRYVLASIMPETKDSEFTWKDYQSRVNSELVGILGNLVNRVMVLSHKYFDGQVPQAGPCDDLKAFIEGQAAKISESLEQFRFREALSEVMNIARHGNQLLSEKEPWKLIKTDRQATAIVLYDCLQIIANLAIACEPFLPFTSTAIFEMLQLNPANFKWADLGRQDLLSGGHRLGEARLLYNKIEDEAIEKQIQKLHQAGNKMDMNENTNKASGAEAQSKIPALKEEITIDDFAKMDLRAGTILEAEKVAGADKLLKLKIDIGLEQRTVVSGIALFFKPEEIIGRKVTLIANLAPRKLRGIESKGMIMMAEDAEGKLVFVTPENAMNGSMVK